VSIACPSFLRSSFSFLPSPFGLLLVHSACTSLSPPPIPLSIPKAKRR
jgi:hypothetical protein